MVGYLIGARQQIASREMYKFRGEEEEVSDVEGECDIRDNRSSLAPRGRRRQRSTSFSRVKEALILDGPLTKWKNRG